MSKEYTWDVELDGTPHRIICVANDNGYDLYDGDDYITRVYKKSFFHNMRGGVETDIEVCGHTLRFVAWRWEFPDMAYDGKLLGCGVPYEEAKKLQRKSVIQSSIVTLVMSCAFLVYDVFRICTRGDLSVIPMMIIWLILGGFSLYRMISHRS